MLELLPLPLVLLTFALSAVLLVAIAVAGVAFAIGRFTTFAVAPATPGTDSSSRASGTQLSIERVRWAKRNYPDIEVIGGAGTFVKFDGLAGLAGGFSFFGGLDILGALSLLARAITGLRA